MKTLQKYPCISCNQEVTQRQEGLLCEGCNRWQHRTCNTGVTRQQYRNAIRTNCDIVWQCTQCSIPEEPNPEEPNFEESGPDFSSDDDVPDPEEPNIEDSDLDEPNFEESGPDFGSYDDEEQNSDKPDSSDELPSVHQPEVLHESLLDDPAPLAALPQDGTVTYSKGKSKRGAEQLISSDGFSYNIMRRNKNGDIKWQCVVRNIKVKCYWNSPTSDDEVALSTGLGLSGRTSKA